MLKKLVVLLVLILSVFALVGCGGGNDKVTVGILLTATHNALDDAKEGFIEALKANGYADAEFVVKNPEGDATTMNSMATDLVRKSDIVLGIGTPAAVALQNARDAEQIDITVLFTAVTDPISAGLMTDVNKPTNITGTNDMNPVADQVDLVLELAPGIKKLGVLYNVSEKNSQVQAEMVKAQAAIKGVEVVIKTVSEAVEITAVTTALITNEGCEAIYIPTDNLIASNMPAVAAVADELKVPTVCGEAGMVAAGGTITYSINYKSLGYLTGEMAAKILSGTPCSEVPSTSVDASGLEVAINDTSIQNIGIEVPQSIKDKLSK
jgi:putative ABC transport system substrate-binding protein